MSIVGPRPEVPEYVALFPREYHVIHQARPGLTDYASIQFRHESDLLQRYPDPYKAYVEVVLPEKLKLGIQYVQTASLREDLRIIAKTVRALFQSKRLPDVPSRS
jgi:lipopolysaccharide/colanic/teichoic acid biosynthesis glycosyltransferase